MRAALYARFSHAEGDSDSCDVQIAEGMKAIISREWTLDPKHIFCDDGHSGREMIKRPSFNRMMQVAGTKSVDVIVARDLDRLARGEPARVLGVLQELVDLNVQVFQYLAGKYVRLDGEHVLLTAFSTYGNRLEATKASVRIREKLEVRLAEGAYTGRAPFGFRNLRRRKSDGAVGIFIERKGTMGVVDRDLRTFPVLIIIGELFIRLGSYNAVAVELNRRNIPSPEGGRWVAASIKTIVTSAAYRGRVERGRTMSVDQGGTLSRTKAPKENVKVYDHPELKVWDDSTVAAIDAMITSRTQTTTWATGRKHLCSSFIRCAECGGCIAISSSKRSRNYCARVSARGCKGIGYRPEPAVDQQLVGMLMGLVAEDVIAEFEAIVTATLDARRKMDLREVEQDRLTREVAGSERRIRNHTAAIGEADTSELRAPLMQALKDERARLDDLRSQLKEADAQPQPEDAKASTPAGLGGRDSSWTCTGRSGCHPRRSSSAGHLEDHGQPKGGRKVGPARGGQRRETVRGSF
jgi:DNA invertase Pin-like site-specific DNA recombinase